MSHMVIYRTTDGKPKFQQVDDIDAAVNFVERLRNTEGVEGSHIYRLEEVAFRFEPYYQVRLEVTEGAAVPPVPPPPPVTVGAPSSAGSIDGGAPPPPEAPAPPAPPIDLTTAGTTVISPPTPAPPAPATTSASVSASRAGDATTEGDAEDEDAEVNGIRRGLFGR